VPSLYTRGLRYSIHSFCLSQCHSFIHAALDMPFIHSVLSSATPLYSFILSPVQPLSIRGARHAIHTFCISQCHPTAPDMSSIHSVLSSAIPLFTQHQICHSFILSYPVTSFIHAAPDMSSIHSVLARAILIYTRHQTSHPFILY
jgi:hypothetical protein